MPIFVAVDESPLEHTYLALVNNILDECGEQTVDNLVDPAPLTRLVMYYLNVTQENIYSSKNWSFTQAVGAYAPVEAAGFTLPDDFDRIGSDPRDRHRQFIPMSSDELDLYVPNQKAEGYPTHYVLWEDKVQFYPLPSAAYATNTYVEGSDGLTYVCIREHDSTAATSPVTGSGWGVYWRNDPRNPAATAWAVDTKYYPGITFKYYRRPTQMKAANDYPDVPVKFVELLKIGARAKTKKWLESPDAGEDYGLYAVEMRKLKRRARREQGPSKMRLYR